MHPQPHPLNNTGIYDQSFDQTWDHLITYLLGDGIEIFNKEKTSGVIEAWAPKDSADFADCGAHVFLDWWIFGDIYTRYIQVSVVPEGAKTNITVHTSFNGHRVKADEVPLLPGAPAPPGDRTACTSKGVVEADILNSL
jgi:hypothetical protein